MDVVHVHLGAASVPLPTADAHALARILRRHPHGLDVARALERAIRRRALVRFSRSHERIVAEAVELHVCCPAGGRVPDGVSLLVDVILGDLRHLAAANGLAAVPRG